jgi:transposase
METHIALQQIIAQHEAKYLTMEAMNVTLQSRCDEYAAAYDALQHQLKELIRYRFGQRSERYLDEDALQAQLFDTVVDVTKPTAEPASTGPDVTLSTTTPPAAKHGTRKHNALPRRIEIIAVAEVDRHCPCGCAKTVIRYETRELIHH